MNCFTSRQSDFNVARFPAWSIRKITWRRIARENRGFSGAREDVEVETNAALSLGFVEEAMLDYEEAFWSGTKPVGRESVLPSRIGEAVRQLGEFPFVARAGNGLVHHRGPRLRKDATSAAMLARRVKEAFDPNGILPSMPES